MTPQRLLPLVHPLPLRSAPAGSLYLQPESDEHDGLIGRAIRIVVARVADGQDRAVLELGRVRVVARAGAVELRPRLSAVGRPGQGRRGDVENDALTGTEELRGAVVRE